MTKRLFLMMEKTPLFFLNDSLQTTTDVEVEIGEEFYKAYQELENNFRVLQGALLEIYLGALDDVQEPLDEDDDDDPDLEDILNPVHDSRTLH